MNYNPEERILGNTLNQNSGAKADRSPNNSNENTSPSIFVDSRYLRGQPSSYRAYNQRKKMLMSEVPFAKNPNIMNSLLRAAENREIEKLSQIKQENNRLLRELENISKGKKLSVGHHQIHIQGQK